MFEVCKYALIRFDAQACHHRAIFEGERNVRCFGRWTLIGSQLSAAQRRLAPGLFWTRGRQLSRHNTLSPLSEGRVLCCRHHLLLTFITWNSTRWGSSTSSWHGEVWVTGNDKNHLDFINFYKDANVISHLFSCPITFITVPAPLLHNISIMKFLAFAIRCPTRLLF